MPDNPNEPLTSNRFLWDLTRCVAESIGKGYEGE